MHLLVSSFLALDSSLLFFFPRDSLGALGDVIIYHPSSSFSYNIVTSPDREKREEWEKNFPYRESPPLLVRLCVLPSSRLSISHLHLARATLNQQSSNFFFPFLSLSLSLSRGNATAFPGQGMPHFFPFEGKVKKRKENKGERQQRRAFFRPN